MTLSKKLLLFCACAGVCLASRRNPDWKLGTVLDPAALHQPKGIETPVYSPDGKAVTTLPAVQRIPLEGTQRVILGVTTAYIVDPGPKEGFKTVGHGLLAREIYVCQLGVREQIFYVEQAEKKGQRLHILDSAGRICALDVVRQEPVQPGTAPKP